MTSAQAGSPVARRSRQREHHVGDRRAGLGIGEVGRELERVAEGLVLVPAAEPSGEIGPRGAHVTPAPVDRVEELPVAGLDGDVHHAGIEVQLADGMAGDARRLPHGRVVLPVRGAEPAGRRGSRGRARRPSAWPGPGTAARPSSGTARRGPSRSRGGRRCPASRPGPNARSAWSAARDRDVEQAIVAEGAVPGDGRLDQVADAVQLVTPGHVAVRTAAADDLDERVEVAVVTLGLGDGRDRLVRRGRKVGFASPAELPADRLEPLVDVRIEERERLVEHHADGPVRTRRAGREPEVVQGAGLRQLLEPVGDRALAIAPQALLPEPVREADARRRDRAERPDAVGAWEDGRANGRAVDGHRLTSRD